MDIYGLAATHIHTEPRSAPMTARAEDRYYTNQIALARLSPALLGSIAMMAGIVLFLGTGLV